MGQLFCAKRSRDMLVTHLPLSLLTSTEENIIISYMFDGSVMHSFLQMKDINIIPIQDVYPEISLNKTEQEFKEEARKLITLGSTPSTKALQRFSLSKEWYTKSATQDQLEVVRRALRSIFARHGQEKCLFTLPKESSEKHKTDTLKKNTRCVIDRRNKTGEGYFLYSAARATNDYSDKEVMIHAYNRYSNVKANAYLQDYGYGIDNDKYALAEMIQWLWRSRIRKGQSVTFYILSERMATLFKEWLYN